MTSLPAAAPTRGLASCATLFFLSFFACAPGPAPEAAEVEDDHAHGSHGWTAFEDGVGLFVDVAPPAAGYEANFYVHFTELATGAPLESGEVRLLLRNGDQVAEVLQASLGETPGFLAMTGNLSAGARQVIFELSREEQSWSFGPFALTVHETLAGADDEAHQLEDAGDPEAISFSVEQQWTARLLADEVDVRDLARRVPVAGSFVTPPTAQALVSASFGGRLLAASSPAELELGQTVEAGDLLGVIEVPLATGDVAALRANDFAWHEHEHELLLREFDLDAQELAATQDAALARSEIRYAGEQLRRIEGLAARELATAREVADAQQSLDEAELHLQSAEELLVTLAQIRSRLEALRAEHATDLRGVEPMRHELRAPIAGQLASVAAPWGATVEAGAPLFEIVDPRALWLELHVPEAHVPQFDPQASLWLTMAAQPGQVLDLQQDLEGRFLHRAPALDPQTRTLTVRYVVNAPGQAGLFVDGQLAVEAVEQVLALPATAIVRQDGLDVAFVQTGGESFEKRVLELGVRDGRFVEVRRGLEAGERAVTRGAYLVRLAASAPDSFGHGHVH